MKRFFRDIFRPIGTSNASVVAMHQVQLPDYIRWSTRLLMAVMMGSLLFMLLAPWQQTSLATGKVIPYAPQERDQVIEAPIKGRLTKWYVQEGEKVVAGQLLVEISDNDPQYMQRLIDQRDAVIAQRDAAFSAIDDYEQQLESLRKVKELELESYDAKINMAQFSVDAAQRTLQAAKGEEKAASLNYERKQALGAQGLNSTREVELAEAKAIKAAADVDKAKAYVAETRSKVLSVKAARESKGSEMDAKISDVRAKLASQREKLAKSEETLSKAEVKISQQTQMKIHAPRSGTILEISAREGADYVKAGDEIALLVPNTEARAVELTINGNDASLVWPGRKVRLQFEGWPAVQFSGWPSVAVGTFGGEVAFVDVRANEKGKFRVLVVPDPDDPYDWPDASILRQGARVNGWIQLNEVTLGFELWRQLNGFPPALPEDVLKESTKRKSKK